MLPTLEFLAEYHKGEYTKAAASWYNVENDYDPIRCESRAQDVLHYVGEYSSCTRPIVHECDCSVGGTVAKLKSLGFQATGTDLNSTAIREGLKERNKWIFAESEHNFFEKYFAGRSLDPFLIHTFQSPAARLDDLLATHRFSVPTNNVVALKIDTEGLEGQVLAGSHTLLASQQPLILAEAGHSNALASRELLPLGYVYAHRSSRQL